MCVLGHCIPAFVKHAAQSGFACIWFDLEHRMISPREVQVMLANFHLADIDCMLRPPTLEKTGLYRYLEEGATGLMIPHVSTADKARRLVDAVKFPPLGDRGLDGAGLDGDYYLHESEHYVQTANDETFLVVQIETIEAVENVDAIASVEGVDGLFIGPADLGMRIRHAPTTPWTLETAFQEVAQAAAKHGKAWGAPAATTASVADLFSQGAQLIAFGSDFGAMMAMFKESSKTFNAVYP